MEKTVIALKSINQDLSNADFNRGLERDNLFSTFNFYLAGKFLECKGELRDFFEPYYNKYVFAHVLYESFCKERVEEMNGVLRRWTEEINEFLSEDSEDRYLQKVKELLQELTLEIKNFSLK